MDYLVENATDVQLGWQRQEIQLYPENFLQRLRKTNQDSWSSGRDLNQGLPNTMQEVYVFSCDVRLLGSFPYI
jgi:hypothetical protein